MNTKQVIVVRTDIKMSLGKLASQVAHAAVSYFTKTAEQVFSGTGWEVCCKIPSGDFPNEEQHWRENSFRKILVAASSEEELEAVHNMALAAGLVSHLIVDNGTTEFDGVPTKTCCAIGPHYDSKFEGITSRLPLLK